MKNSGEELGQQETQPSPPSPIGPPSQKENGAWQAISRKRKQWQIDPPTLPLLQPKVLKAQPNQKGLFCPFSFPPDDA